MRDKNSAIAKPRLSLSAPVSGAWWGLLGVAAFSFTIPFTRVAVGGFSALFVGSARAVVAALLAAAALAITRQPVPPRRLWGRIAVVAAGIVVGFPLLTSYALERTSASHGAVVIALLPAATAALAVIRGHERPPRIFWALTLLGACAAVGFALVQSGDIGRLQWADLLLFGAVLAAAVGYAEGGLLARELGAWQTVSWALMMSAPVMIALTVLAARGTAIAAGPAEWAALGYLSAVSMYLGFFAWYRGLAIGPMAQVSQIQLVQPVLSLIWAVLLLGESLSWQTAVGAVVVVGFAALAVRVRLHG
ncbi:EamA family transporter [Epidermidibacterium keratini]|uniref:EamA family transporter n=1 Tax=Epidermidibacterium keratini TaxID=1891644 RepID=A0A7L4YQI3_9ACTN|nr:DMT family transporter [Epidermidibacterium keratini]QHC01164.1 EamA family transporter [Epidermidibacterium keratini]